MIRELSLIRSSALRLCDWHSDDIRSHIKGNEIAHLRKFHFIYYEVLLLYNKIRRFVWAVGS